MTMASETSEKIGTWAVVAIGALVLLALLAGGSWFYKVQEQDLRHQAETQLEAIGRLKADEVALWRQGMLEDAAVLVERLALIADAKQMLAAPTAKAAEETLRRFRSLQKQYRYYDVLLVDAEGRVHLNLEGPPGTHHIGIGTALEAAMREQKPILTELYAGEVDQMPQIGVVAPLSSDNERPLRPVGAVIMLSDARTFLYPLVESWPVPSRTAETILVRRDGDDVLFMSNLSHQPDAAMKLRIPLSRSEVPAVKAVLGHEGVFEGKDYDGRDVLAVLRAIPDSPWFMVAKVDTAEAFSTWRLSSVLILLLLSGSVVLTGVVVLLLGQRNMKAHYRALYRSEAALRRSEERYGITLKSIGDAVIATDAAGRVEFLNPVAETLTGWSKEEAWGRHIEEVFHIVNEETRQKVENPVDRVLREGVVVELANHTLLMARDGSRRPIADSGAPIRDDRDAVSGVVMVFRDQTEEREAIDALQAAARDWQATFDAILDPVALLSVNGKVEQCNRAFVSLFGSGEASPKGEKCYKLVHGTDDHISGCPIVRARRSGSREDMELSVGGRTFQVLVDPVKAPAGDVAKFVHIMRDITEHKRSEELLRESEDRHRDLVESSQDLICTHDLDGHILSVNARPEQVLGYTRDELLRMNIGDLLVPEKRHLFGEYLGEIRRNGCAQGLMHIQTKDGEHRIWEYHNSLRSDGVREPVVRGVAHDVTEQKRAEYALRESEALFRRLFEHHAAVKLVIDPDSGSIIDANKAAADFYGWSREELRRMKVSDINTLPPEEVKAAMKQVRTLERTQFQFRHRRADSSIRDIEVFSSMIKVGGKELLHSVIHDITARKRAEDGLMKEKVLSETIISSLPGVFYLFDDQGRFLRWNRNLEEVSGYSAEEFARLSPLDFFEGEDRTIIEQAIQEVFARGENTAEGALLSKDGRKAPYFFTGRRLELDGRTCLIGMGIDISARKEAEEMVRSFMAWSPVGIYLLQEGRFLMANDWFQTITGYSREELSQKVPLDLIHPEDRHQTRENVLRLLTSGSKAPYQYRAVSKSGAIKWIAEMVTPIQWKGGRATLGFFMDITESKLLEEKYLQAQKMEAVGRLAGGVAHDFNNMLGIILGCTELALLETVPNTPMHNNLKEVQKAAGRSADLTSQLLAFARKQTIDPKVLDLNSTVERTIVMLRRLIGEDIDLVWVPAPELWPVKMDLAQVDQVIANLCVNARDAITGVGKVTIETANIILDEAYCAAHTGFVPGEFVMLAVSDNGCGMDPETVNRLFEPFFTTKELGKGTGLGLATVYGIVRQNEGFINVYSELGRGTILKIYIPRYAAGIAEAAGAPSKDFPLGCGETVLLVEDEPGLLSMAEDMLEYLGYNVLTAASPLDAMRLAGEHPGKIHLLITDVVMPEVSGRELAKRLVAIEPGMKCLFMSGYTSNVIAHHGVLDEGVCFLQKPFTMHELALRVREVLDR